MLLEISQSLTEVKKKSKALTEKASGDMPPAKCYGTLHHTRTFNTRRKTRKETRIARTFFHTSGFFSTSSGRDSNFSGHSSDKRIRSSQP